MYDIREEEQCRFLAQGCNPEAAGSRRSSWEHVDLGTWREAERRLKRCSESCLESLIIYLALASCFCVLALIGPTHSAFWLFASLLEFNICLFSVWLLLSCPVFSGWDAKSLNIWYTILLPSTSQHRLECLKRVLFAAHGSDYTNSISWTDTLQA